MRLAGAQPSRRGVHRRRPGDGIAHRRDCQLTSRRRAHRRRGELEQIFGAGLGRDDERPPALADHGQRGDTKQESGETGPHARRLAVGAVREAANGDRVGRQAHASPQARGGPDAVAIRAGLEVQPLALRVFECDTAGIGHDVEDPSERGDADRVGHRPLDQHHLVSGVSSGAHHIHQVWIPVELARLDPGGGLHPRFSMCSRAARSRVRSKWCRTRVPLASSSSLKVWSSLRSAASVSPPSAWMRSRT